MSIRLKLTISYAAILVLAGALVLAALWVFISYPTVGAILGLSPSRYELFVSFVPAAVVVLLFLLVFGLVGGWLLAGRILAPLYRITAATRKAANGSLSHRIELTGPRDEFSELADSFDTMLARLEAHDAEQRRFAANASHELRTPLAVMQTLLEVAQKDPDHVNPELLERLGVVNTRAIELTQALLLLSRTQERSFTKRLVDLSLVAEEAAETLLPLAEKNGVAIDTSGEAVHTRGSHAAIRPVWALAWRSSRASPRRTTEN
jgi:two-component system sensor histidine kinase VanS